jgi:hypothetical protein
MSLLDVVATPAHVTDRLLRAVSPGLSAIAPGTACWDDLLVRLTATLTPDRSVAPPEVERLALAAAVREVLPAYDPAYLERANTLDAFARTLDILRSQGADADTLEAARSATQDIDEGPRARLRCLAEVLRAHDARLAAQGLTAHAAVESHLARAIDVAREAKVSPSHYGLPDHLRLWHLSALPPARVALIVALARWLSAHRGRTEAHVLCEPRRMKLPLTLDRALRAMEAEEGAALELQFGLRDPSAEGPDGGLGAWILRVAEGAQVHESASAAPAPVALSEAKGPDEEARWIAARVRRWIDEGITPRDIAVVFRRTGDETVATLGRCLDDAGVAWQDPRGRPLLGSPLARAVLSLPRAVARGADREEVLRTLAVLQGNVARPGEPAPWRVAAALRQMGAESLFDTELTARARIARKKGASGAVIAAIEGLARDLWDLAQDGTVTEHAARLTRWLHRAGGDGRFLEESRAVITAAGTDAGAQAILRALARDEAGLGATAELLRDLPALSVAAGRSGRVSVGEFSEMVLDLARVRQLDDPDRDACDGVQILAAREAAGRCFAAVALPGMQDGGFPARREDEALWDDPERMAVGKAQKAPIERSASREDESLLLLSVLATATRAVAVSAARHDAGGRVHTPSPFFGDLQRTAGVTVERVGSDPLARSRRLPPCGPERTLRAAARAHTDGVIHDPALTSVIARADVELRRQAFFAAPGQTGGPYTGRIDHDPALVARLELARWAGFDRPLDTTTLERAARCGFKAFALEVLKIEERHDTAETLDDKERGHLLHKLLEAAQDALKETRGQDTTARWQALTAALDEAGDEFSLKESQVHAGLLEADLRAIRRQVEQWLTRRLRDPDAWEMVASEIAFGPNRTWPPLVVPMETGAPVVIRGRIDGIERSGGALRAVEFKSGRGDGYRRRLQEGALDTQFQLVVYAAALEGARRAGAIEGHAGQVDGLYVGFRDLGEHSLREALSRPRAGRPLWDLDALVAEGALGGGALGESVKAVVAPLRSGHFEPRPRDCDFCQYRSLCRVEAFDDDAELQQERA